MKDQVAVVTGAAQGLGEAMALRFAQEGANVVVCDVDLDGARELSKKITDMGRKSLFFKVDVTNIDHIKTMVQKTVDEFKRIDILINNAGISDQLVPTIEQDVDKWERCFDIHMKGTYLCCKEVGTVMVKNQYGRIVNMSSIAGLGGGAPWRTAYSPAKAAIIMLTKILAAEWAPLNINVNAVAPCHVMTNFVASLVKAGKLNPEAIIKRIPKGRMAKVEEVVNVVYFLCSEQSNFVTGQTIAVDGGHTAFGYFGMPSDYPAVRS